MTSLSLQPINGLSASHQIAISTDLSHLPTESKDDLSYLIHFQNSSARCPFTRDQEAIFLGARKWEKINSWSLKSGLAGCTALSIAPAFLGLNAIQNWENNSPNHASLMFIVVTLYAGAIGMINYICTGTVPDKAAMAAIKATNEASKARKTYEDIACGILKIYKKNPIAAKDIAGKINIENIRTAMNRFIPPSVGEEICSPLHFAAQAVLTDEIDDRAPSLVKLQWENIEFDRKFNSLAARVTELETQSTPNTIVMHF